jgi:glycerol-3-phosphate acyltransferase PlsY
MIETCHFWFNVIEAGIWFALAGWLLFLALKRQSSLKKTFLVFSATLFVFGISDLIETQTGAWYKPFSLFMLKAVCVLFIAGCLVVLFRSRSECEQVMNGKEDSQPKEE